MADKIRIEQHSVGGLIWFAGWLYTIGFLDLSIGRGILALIIWPYYLGAWVAALIAP